MHSDDQRPIYVTVSGSFRRHWDAVKAAIEELRTAQCQVLSPQGSEPERTTEGFVYLTGESGSPVDIETRHLDAIARSDGLYVVSKDGYVGASVSLEIGYAIALGVPIWSSERLAEVPHRDLVTVGSVSEMVTALKQSDRLREKRSTDSLQGLQSFYRAIAARRGFEEEPPEHVLILLMEEVGELAKAIRNRIGVAMKEDDTSRKSIRLELADCFNYLLHMANQTEVDLYAAFLEKERLNSRKRWTRPRKEK